MCPPPTTATQEPAKHSVASFLIVVMSSRYGYSAFLSLKGVFVHFPSSHFITQRGDQSTIMSGMQLVIFSSVKSIFYIFQVSSKLWHFKQ